MKILYDFFPILLFFVVYKFYGDIPPDVISAINTVSPFPFEPGQTTHAIFLATAVAIVASFLQVGMFWLRHRRFEKMHLISLALISVFGGATLAFRDPLFIKWKPTVLNWLFAAVFLGSRFIGKQPIVQRMMSHAIDVPAQIWQRVNLAWVIFFLLTGVANIYVAYNFSENTWVNFKLFGLLALTFVFVLAQSLYLSRHIVED